MAGWFVLRDFWQEDTMAEELTATQKDAIREAHKNGDTVEALADAYGVPKATIERLVTAGDARKSTSARKR